MPSPAVEPARSASRVRPPALPGPAELSASESSPTTLGAALVLHKRQVAPGHWELVLEAPEAALQAQPGQVVHLRASEEGSWDPLLRRPFSVYWADPQAGRLAVLFRVQGRGTEWLARRQPGDRVDLMGPAGRGFWPMDGLRGCANGARRSVVVGGGVGVAPLYFLATRLPVAAALLGFRTAGHVIAAEDFRSLGVEIRLATEDGTRGQQGLVTDLLVEALEAGADGVYACGPEPMLRAVVGLCRARGVPCQVSLEGLMACGVGACLSCVVDGPGGKRRVCVDGPVFAADEVTLPEHGAVPVPAAVPARVPVGEPALVRVAMPPPPPKARPEGPDLSVELAGLRLRNPVMTASGCFGYGKEFAGLVDLSQLGAVVVKGVSLEPWGGNPVPRIWETPAGMLNSIGLQNPGVERFVRQHLPFLRELGTPVIVNVVGKTLEEYVEVSRRLQEAGGVAALELNISCPNVRQGGMHFGNQPKAAHRLTQAVRRAVELPIVVKLSPNAADIAAVARAVEQAGADAISLINTLVGMAIDVERRRPALATGFGGLSGPAIRPLAVRMVWEVYRAVRTPIIGMGGITSARDALEFILAGARAVAVGTATLVDPQAPLRIVAELRDWLAAHGVGSVEELVGEAHATGGGLGGVRNGAG